MLKFLRTNSSTYKSTAFSVQISEGRTELSNNIDLNPSLELTVALKQVFYTSPHFSFKIKELQEPLVRLMIRTITSKKEGRQTMSFNEDKNRDNLRKALNNTTFPKNVRIVKKKNTQKYVVLFGNKQSEGIKFYGNLALFFNVTSGKVFT